MSRPQCISPNNDDGEVIYSNPDDPINVLSPPSPRDRRKISFISSLLSPITDGSTNRTKPIVKLVHTQPNLKGRYVWVHAYHRHTDRYGVTLLDAKSTGDGSAARHPALLYYGPHELDSKKDSSSRALFLPPATMGQLSLLDVISLYLQYLAVDKLSSPQLCSYVETLHQSIQQMMDSLPPFSWGIFVILLLPLFMTFTMAKLNESTPPIPTTSKSLHTSDMLTLLSFLIGIQAITRFLITEYKTIKQKATTMQHDNQNIFSPSEMLQYRMDYYFSTSKWAKVGFLSGLTFILIVVGAALLALFLDDHSISSAAWMSWTFVADPGE